jgi:hypothetical protein
VNVNLLIDAIVRQTTVLIAQLATTAGARAPLAHTANRVFLDLTRELKQQGLGSKVISDMFGLTLRAYHAKVARLSESGTERGRSLWEAILGFVQDKGSVSHLDVLRRFSGDEERVVRSVLRDLVETGMLYRSGRGDFASYRAANLHDAAAQVDPTEHVASLVWIVVYRHGPLSAEALGERLPVEKTDLGSALERLVADGRVVKQQQGDTVSYSTDGCVIPLGSMVGWEAAVFDHYQALVIALCTKLRLGRSRAAVNDWIGGSTYSAVVWEGHPLRDEVTGLLRETRARASELRTRVEAYNVNHVAPASGDEKVLFYVGQAVLGLDEQDGEDT